LAANTASQEFWKFREMEIINLETRSSQGYNTTVNYIHRNDFNQVSIRV